MTERFVTSKKVRRSQGTAIRAATPVSRQEAQNAPSAWIPALETSSRRLNGDPDRLAGVGGCDLLGMRPLLRSPSQRF